MPRPPAKCGTRTGYRKHLREKTPPCKECKKANNEYKTSNKKEAENKRRQEIKQTLTHLQPNNITNIIQTNNEDIDPRIADLKENLAFIKNAFFIATPKELPALSKRRQELEEEIYRLEHNTDERQTLADKLAQIRSYRQSTA